MTHRYTKHDVLAAFIRLTNLLNVPVYIDKRDLDTYVKFNDLAPFPKKLVCHKRDLIGAWSLDYAACYGGWTVTELMDKGGAGNPLGSQRVSARSFCDLIYFCENVMRAKQALDKSPQPA